MSLKEKIQRADPFNNGSCRKISEVEKGLNRPYSREVSVIECKFFLKLKYPPIYSESFLLDVKEKNRPTSRQAQLNGGHYQKYTLRMLKSADGQSDLFIMITLKLTKYFTTDIFVPLIWQ